MNIGIFFGGLSAEREVSFHSGQVVYRCLDRQLFTPIPIFVDSLGNFIILHQDALTQTAIRQFYPAKKYSQPSDFEPYIESLAQLSDTELMQHIRHIGTPLLPTDFGKVMDFAFIAMHGPYGEDGALQGLLEWYKIPYSGSGVMASAIGIDKIAQNQLIKAVNQQRKKYTSLTRQTWKTQNQRQIFENLHAKIGVPMVLKAPHQGSSLGVKIVRENNFDTFYAALNACFSILQITQNQWIHYDKSEKIKFINDVLDVTKGIGMPVYWGENLDELIYYPENLYQKLNQHFKISDQKVTLTSIHGENEILVEEFIAGREFTCSVIMNDAGDSIALIPAEVVKEGETDFDYEAKYKNHAVEEKIVMNASDAEIQQIQRQVKQVFDALGFNVYARIDGFLLENQEVMIHDPNTIPGMTSASFIFRQLAEIGLNATQTLTFLVRNSIAERIRTGKNGVMLQKILEQLDAQITDLQKDTRKVVALFFGGFTKAQNLLYQSEVKMIYAQLSASADFRAMPIYVHGTPDDLQFEVLPVNLMYQDSIWDVRKKLRTEKHPFVQRTVAQTQKITKHYAGDFSQKSENIRFEQILQQSDVCWFAESELERIITKDIKEFKINLFDETILAHEI